MLLDGGGTAVRVRESISLIAMEVADDGYREFFTTSPGHSFLCTSWLGAGFRRHKQG